ncbi:GNAT family N-acetyltransferase [Pseudonocardia sp. D17]|uniref:GNAT family N-acetyltransferase n=1 Tax=Pseudonocardia sp. D17 TaxID=882661 RepID=UPI0030CBA7D7
MGETRVPRLDADGLVLRGFCEHDLPMVVEASCDGAIPRVTTVPACADEFRARAWIRLQYARVTDRVGYPFVIADSDTDEPLGQIGLWFLGVGPGRARIGYWVLARNRRRGLATRALQTLSPWALTLPEVERLELYVEPWNKGSWRAAETAGFHREGLMRGWEVVGTERRDMYMYSLLRSDVA